MRSGTALVVALALLAGCGDEAAGPAGGAVRGGTEAKAPETAPLAIDDPRDGSVFPPGFVPPTFLWHDAAEGVSGWRIEFAFEDGEEVIVARSDGPPPPRGEIDPRALGPTNEIHEGTAYQRSARSWRPDAGTWAEVQRRSVDAPAVVTIEGLASDDAVSSRGAIRIRTSEDPVGAPIFYRDVPLMPSRGEAGVIKPLSTEAIPLIAWRLRDVTRPESKVVLTGMPSCANCHSFSLDGKTLGMDVDGPQGDKGTYAIADIERTTVIGDEQLITWNDFADRREDQKTIGFLSRISPDGRIAVTTLNESLYVANFTNYKFLQVFFPTRGILAWTSRETGEMKALPGADDTDYVHCDPAWYPDGKQLVFARATACDPYTLSRPLAAYPGDPNETEIRYDLYRMPFAEGKGGTPVPIEGASSNGMSNTFPKISPDGKWLVFTKCANGQLMRPDGRLWIVPAEGGEAREMRCNTDLMNSWHSFSPNSRWMVFSSKINSPYTQIFLTHIDEDGNDTPAVLIPNSTAANRAVNIPEFLNAPYDALDAIDAPAVEHHRRYQEGLALLEEKRYEEALSAFESTLEEEPEFSRAIHMMGYTLLELDRVEEALEHLKDAVRVAPYSSEAHYDLGLAHARQGEVAEAAKLYRRAIHLDFLNAPAHHNLGLALLATGDPDAALRSLREAARLAPEDAGVRNDHGFVLARLRRIDEAVREYRAAIALDPEHLRARKNLGFVLLGRGDLPGALLQYRKALEIDPRDAGTHRGLSRILRARGELAASLGHLEKALEIDPTDLQSRLTLAWHLATLPHESQRDGARAVVLAESALEQTGTDDPKVLDILAAAYAEAGRFEDAVDAARKAERLVKADRGEVAPGLEDRIQAYEAGRPYRQPERRTP